MNTEFELFPEAASTAAGAVDALYLFMVAFSAAMSAVVAGLIVYFAIKYRRANDVDRAQRPTSMKMELSWIALSLPVLMLIFFWGAKVCFFLFRSPEGAMPVTVVAKQWMWKFQHADGRREIDVLHVPINQPVRLTMVSQDVIHSFFVPAFRVKQDVLPGRYTSVWFEATKPGDYRLYCAEYCGANHSRMIGRVVAQTPGDFAEWLAGRGADDEPPHVTGAKLFEQFQCATCHRLGADGQQSRGPSLAGIFNQPVALASGGTVVADEAYLRESILRPAAKLVAGYQSLMPTFEGQLSEEQVLQLIAYIKTLGADNRETSPGISSDSTPASTAESPDSAESPPPDALTKDQEEAP
jgi:cytochrome c oxidase subunit II